MMYDNFVISISFLSIVVYLLVVSAPLQHSLSSINLFSTRSHFYSDCGAVCTRKSCLIKTPSHLSVVIIAYEVNGKTTTVASGGVGE